ncbi:MAG: hypothetical protein KJ058_00570 [Thermoanaerobaculia bacterium]|nr:hypothetical protein [Thermoanaerobaculia bacterium]
MTSDAAASIGLVLAAQRLAEALVCGFADCHTEGRPLTELQRKDITAAALLAFDGLHAELDAHVLLEQRLAATLRPRRRDPVIPSDVDPDLPYTAADDRLMDALGNEDAYR